MATGHCASCNAHVEVIDRVGFGALAFPAEISEVEQLKADLIGQTMGGREKYWSDLWGLEDIEIPQTQARTIISFQSRHQMVPGSLDTFGCVGLIRHDRR